MKSFHSWEADSLTLSMNMKGKYSTLNHNKKQKNEC